MDILVDIKVIEELSNAFGPSGFEDAVVGIIRKYSSGLEIEVDSMNNVYTRLHGNKGDRPVIMLDCHSDEVGFMVQSVMSNGLIKFLPLGGWIVTNVPAHTVVIQNSRGEYIKGITTSRPPHFMSEADREKKLTLEDIYIDVGATSREEVINDFAIEPGNAVVPDVTFSYNEKNGVVFGKAFDNRMGCLCLIEVMKRLKDADLNIDVVGAFAAQEEVGTRGAEVTARTVKPDLAIVFEGSPADDLYYDECTAQGCLKKGTQIRHIDRSMVSNPHFIKFAREIARVKNVTYQSAVRAQGGTNGGKIHVSNKGVPTLVLGIPVRYAHSHYCYSAEFDINATIDLAVEVIKSLDCDRVKELLRQK
jgi:Cellulase M and related proteins